MNQMTKLKYIEEKNGEYWLTEDERDHLKISYKIKEIIYSGSSPYQHIMILDSYSFGRMLVLDGIVQTTALDGHIYNEMISHVPLFLHANPKKVLIIGGGDCGVAREICKHPSVEQIDMVEIDEMVVGVCKTYLPEVSGNLNDPRVHFIFSDGVQFVKDAKSEYDVIIVDSSDPIGPAVQLFEQEFYQSIHHALKEDGIFVCQSESPLFHQDVLKQSYRHIRDLFTQTNLYTATVPTYPGGFWSFTLGSKKEWTFPSEKSFDLANTNYVNREILESCFKLPVFIEQLIHQ